MLSGTAKVARGMKGCVTGGIATDALSLAAFRTGVHGLDMGVVSSLASDEVRRVASSGGKVRCQGGKFLGDRRLPARDFQGTRHSANQKSLDRHHQRQLTSHPCALTRASQ